MTYLGWNVIHVNQCGWERWEGAWNGVMGRRRGDEKWQNEVLQRQQQQLQVTTDNVELQAPQLTIHAMLPASASHRLFSCRPQSAAAHSAVDNL